MWKWKKKNKGDCGICLEYKKVILDIQIYKNKDTKCTINHPYCQHCLSKHITCKIEETKTPNIQCPGCPEPLDPVGCSTIISQSTFLEWTTLLAESFVNQSNSRLIECPYHGCREVLLVDQGQGLNGSRGRKSPVKCPWCSRWLCDRCGAKWTSDHRGGDCDNVDTVFLDTARRLKLQRCPSCHFFVQREYGCDSISCRCGETFCYKCGTNKMSGHTHTAIHDYSPNFGSPDDEVPRRPDVVPRRPDDEVPRRPDVVPRRPNVVPRRPNVVPRRPDVVPPNVVPRRPDVVPPNVVPRRPDEVPRRPDVVPPNVVPRRPDVVPRRPNVVPRRPDEVPRRPDVVPRRPDVVPRRPNDIFLIFVRFAVVLAGLLGFFYIFFKGELGHG